MEFIEEYKKYDILLKFCLAGEISVGKTLFKEKHSIRIKLLGLFYRNIVQDFLVIES